MNTYPVDFHVHTTHYSNCGHQTIDEVIAVALERGLHAVCLTEHHFRWFEEDLHDVLVRTGAYGRLVLLPGEEIAAFADDGTKQGDYLVFGVDHSMGRHDVRRLIPEVHDLGGIVIAAHPMRTGYGSDEIVEHLALDGLEVYNKNHDAAQQLQAWRSTQRSGILPLGASDAHRVEYVGVHVTYFPEPIATLDEFVKGIRNRRTRIDPVPGA
jgi:predicted metal-dependent phosphoesterase TrpH